MFGLISNVISACLRRGADRDVLADVVDLEPDGRDIEGLTEEVDLVSERDLFAQRPAS